MKGKGFLRETIFPFFVLCLASALLWSISPLHAQEAAPPSPEQIEKARELLRQGASPEVVKEKLALPEP